MSNTKIKVTNVNVYKVKHNTLKANADITLNDEFVVKGLKIIKGRDGLFVSMPSYNYNDEYKDLCFPLSKALRTHITETVLEEYENN